MMTAAEIADLARGKAVADVACPVCGPQRTSVINRKRAVLRIWSQSDGFTSWHCARCGERGHSYDGSEREIDRKAWQQRRQEIEARNRGEAAAQLRKAHWLWRQGRAITGTIAARYLREARGISCPLPPTLRYLPPRDGYEPAMIAAFGMPDEIEPGLLSTATLDVLGVHVTRLKPDGSGKIAAAEDRPAKITLGRGSTGWPIVLAPPNDLLGLVIGEGIEDVLSAHSATTLGGWAGGSAGRLPALADRVPRWIDCVSVLVDDDEAGRKHASELVARLNARGIHAQAVGG